VLGTVNDKLIHQK